MNDAFVRRHDPFVPTPMMYYLFVEVKPAPTNVPDYSHLETSVFCWVKARNQPEGKRIVTEALKDEGWLVKNFQGSIRVERGTLMILEMLDPESFPRDETDQWIECFDQAKEHGHWFEFRHYLKKELMRNAED